MEGPSRKKGMGKQIFGKGEEKNSLENGKKKMMTIKFKLQSYFIVSSLNSGKDFLIFQDDLNRLATTIANPISQAIKKIANGILPSSG